MHLDTPYVRMWVDTKERYFLFLFDKHRNHIPWEQRQKEIEGLNKSIEANKKEIAIWNKIIEDLNALPDVKLLDK